MKLVRLLCILFLTVCIKNATAQDPNVSIYIENGQYISARIYQFDIMIKATGSTSSFQLRTFQAGLYVNPAWVNGGNLTGSNAATFSDMSGPGYNGAFLWNATDKLLNCSVNMDVVSASGCIATTVTSTPKRITRVQVKNTVDFTCTLPDIKFNYVSNPDPYRLRTTFSWRAAGCTTNYDMFYPGRTFNGTATFNGELYTANDADGRSPIGTAVASGFCSGELKVTAYLEGYYLGPGQMNTALYNSFIAHANTEQADSITIQLKSTANPSGPAVATYKTILYSDGNAYCIFPLGGGLVGNSYWLVVKHRNAIETWSAAPVTIAARTGYNFTTAQNKAFGNNLVMTADNQAWAIYSGDISDATNASVGSQDGVIESQDYGDMENAVYSTLTGYVFEDITGDGVVESTDYSIMENNVSVSIFSMHP